MNSFWQLFKANLKMFIREKEGFYWTILMPAGIYIALSVIPIGNFLKTGTAYSNFLLPGLIAMTIMQGGVYSLAYWMVDLKARGITKRLLATPLKQGELVLSLVCARLVIVLIQVIILTLLGILIFHAQFAGNVLSVLLIVLMGGAIFLLVGLLISNYAKSYDSAAPLTSAIGLPLPFFSSVFYPLEILPHALQTIAKLLPMYYLADGLRQAFLFSFDFYKLLADVLVLSLWLVFMLALTLWLFNLRED